MDFPVALLENCIKTAQRENIAYANELYTSLNEIKANNQTSEYSYWSLLEPSTEILEYNNDLKRTGFSNLVHDAKFTANVYESILDIPAENVAQQLALIEENLYEKLQYLIVLTACGDVSNVISEVLRILVSLFHLRIASLNMCLIKFYNMIQQPKEDRLSVISLRSLVLAMKLIISLV